VSGRTRSNITVAERDGTVTKINEPGAALTAAELDLVLTRVLADAVPGSWAVLCGSLPPGAPTDEYARMTRRLVQAGVRVAVDTSGPALARAVEAGPDLIKPNAEELAAAVGHPLDSRGDVIRAAQELRARGALRVLVSLGAAGAVLVDDEGVTLGEVVAVEPRSTVGAGDAFLAGFLAFERTADLRRQTTGESPPSVEVSRAALRQALAWGAAAVQLPGSEMPGPADIDPGTVHLFTSDVPDERLAEPLVGTG
jgi:1-phosphofructokinase